MAAGMGWDSAGCDWEKLARKLSRQGIAVYASGRRGDWGVPDADYRRLGYQRGDIDQWETWARDYAEFTRFVAARHPSTPLVLAGHSMGTLDVLNAAGDARWAGARPAAAVLYVPAFGMLYPSGGVTLLRCLLNMQHPPKTRFGEMASMEERGMRLVNEASLNHAMLHARNRAPNFTFHFVREARSYARSADRAAHDIRVPVLWFSGGEDDLATSLVAQPHVISRFQSALCRAPGTHHPIAGASHGLIFEEPECSEAARVTAAWLRGVLAH
jgi:alpha-beta hydrolase superfamily lysophospholipase